MEAVLRRFEGAQGSGLTDFPFPGARRDPRNFLVGPAVFIHEFQEQTLQKSALPGVVALVASPWWSHVIPAKYSRQENELLGRRTPQLVVQR